MDDSEKRKLAEKLRESSGHYYIGLDELGEQETAPMTLAEMFFQVSNNAAEAGVYRIRYNLHGVTPWSHKGTTDIRDVFKATSYKLDDFKVYDAGYNSKEDMYSFTVSYVNFVGLNIDDI